MDLFNSFKGNKRLHSPILSTMKPALFVIVTWNFSGNVSYKTSVKWKTSGAEIIYSPNFYYIALVIWKNIYIYILITNYLPLFKCDNIALTQCKFQQNNCRLYFITCSFLWRFISYNVCKIKNILKFYNYFPGRNAFSKTWYKICSVNTEPEKTMSHKLWHKCI